jgi:hypothetical protein
MSEWDAFRQSLEALWETLTIAWPVLVPLAVMWVTLLLAVGLWWTHRKH